MVCVFGFVCACGGVWVCMWFVCEVCVGVGVWVCLCVCVCVCVCVSVPLLRVQDNKGKTGPVK